MNRTIVNKLSQNQILNFKIQLLRDGLTIKKFCELNSNNKTGFGLHVYPQFRSALCGCANMQDRFIKVIVDYMQESNVRRVCKDMDFEIVLESIDNPYSVEAMESMDFDCDDNNDNEVEDDGILYDEDGTIRMDSKEGYIDRDDDGEYDI